MRHLLFLLLFRLVRMMRPRPPMNGQPASILILQYAKPLGCCVHGTPIYAAIKKALPNCRLLVATQGLGFATVQHDPHIDGLIQTGDPMRSMGDLWKTVRALRKHLRAQGWRPDWVLQDASNRRGTYALLSLLLAVAPSAGFADAPELYDRHIAYDPALSLIDNNLRLAALVGPAAQHREPEIYFTPNEWARVAAMTREANPNALPMAAFVMQGSGGQRTGWHDQRFVDVVRHAAAAGLLPVFVGTAEDAPGIERVRTMAASAGFSLAGRTSIPELAALLCACDLVVSVDTGTMHVGRSAGVPMVVLGPSWQKPLEWLPLGVANVRILRGQDLSDVPGSYRLDEIAAADVISAFDELLRLYPPSAQNREDRLRRRLSTN